MRLPLAVVATALVLASTAGAATPTALQTAQLFWKDNIAMSKARAAQSATGSLGAARQACALLGTQWYRGAGATGRTAKTISGCAVWAVNTIPTTAHYSLATVRSTPTVAVFDATMTSDGGQEAKLRMTLRKEHGRWLIEKFQTLPVPPGQ